LFPKVGTFLDHLTKIKTAFLCTTAANATYFASIGTLATHLHREIIGLTKKIADAPEFFPHVTLIGGIEQPKDQVLKITEQLVSTLKQPLQIEFEKVSSGDIFHQCVYILCKASDPLNSAARAAKEAFGLDPCTPYMPHLSLVYSDMSTEHRQALAAEMQQKLCPSNESSGGEDEKLVERGFLADSLAVWYTPVEDKTLESWRAVSVFPLQ
jgi:hypothetical protein